MVEFESKPRSGGKVKGKKVNPNGLTITRSNCSFVDPRCIMEPLSRFLRQDIALERKRSERSVP